LLFSAGQLAVEDLGLSGGTSGGDKRGSGVDVTGDIVID
jgi:hypothetical protein